jgi:PTH1 family peptidyl-tRNA hydrolase
VIEELATTFALSVDKKKFDTLFGRGSIEEQAVILAKPMAFMNNSGPPVKQLADYFRISSQDLLVVHDDIDLAFGRLNLKEKGGHAGHKGVKSLLDAFGKDDFARLRIGIGRSVGPVSVTDHVLGGFSVEETKMLKGILARAREAVVTILNKGIKDGMNRFNDKRFEITS